MTDLQHNDPSSNIYFRNRRIRRHLIQAGLISPQGDILTDKLDANSLPRRRKTKENGKNAITNYVTNESEKRQEFIRNQFDFTARRAREKKPRESSQPRRGISKPLNNVDEHPKSTTVRLPSPTNKKRSSMRAKSARHSSSNINKHSAGRPATAKSPNKDRCRVVMIYYGPQTKIDYDDSWFQPKGDEISVSQQHCGGENLTVFKGYVQPNEKFAFDSRRHPDYPFALAFYVNGRIDSRISVCCEYKHKQKVRLGGKRGLFGIDQVYKVKPCRSCRRDRRKKKSLLNPSIALDPSRYEKSIVPQVSSTPRSHSPVASRSSSPPRASLALRSHSPVISRSASPSRLSLTNKSHSPVISQTPSAPRAPLTTQPRSPPLTRTPSPQLDDERPSALEPNRTQLKRQSDSKSNSSKKSDGPNEENYTSDFDETNNNDHLASDSRFSRPHISESQINGNKEDSDHSSDTLDKSISSDDDENDHRPSRVLSGKNNAIGHLQSTSSSSSQKSDPSDDEIDDPSSKGLAGLDMPVSHSRRSSSTTSKKSDPSPKNEVKRKSIEKNNEDDWFTSATAPANDFGHRQLSSTSKDRSFAASSVKKSEDSLFSSKNEIRTNRPYSGENNEDDHFVSNVRSNGINKTDTNDDNETNLFSTRTARPWTRDTDSDQDNKNSSNKKDSFSDWL